MKIVVDESVKERSGFVIFFFFHSDVNLYIIAAFGPGGHVSFIRL